MSDRILRIGNAGGYWGDDPTALMRQVQGATKLDYVTMDFLAEVTMSIMQKQRARDPKLGYARDYLAMLEGVLGVALEKGTRIITNAGGVNPVACAEAISELADKLGLKPKIAVVFGDDILPLIDELQTTCSFANMETGQPFAAVADRLQSANIYFGAAPVVDALKAEPDLIITGRVTDTGITIAPMIHEFGWSLDDWDRLAAGTVAGHILECGTQSTGGNFTDWEKVPTFANIGYPIVEVEESGAFTVTKHAGTGGLVSTDTVREQLFYEMGDPKAYITPDVVADFATIQLEQEGADRVRVHSVKGYEPTPTYKISMAYEDGYKAVGDIVVSGPDARKKAEAFAEIFWQRCGRNFVKTQTEFFGFNACHRSLVHAEEANEILLRLGVRDNSREKLRAFGKLIPSLILGGPPGTCVIGGVPRIQEVVSYWPALIDKQSVPPRVALYAENRLADETAVTSTRSGNFSGSPSFDQSADSSTKSIADVLRETREGVALSSICLARSGDKGDTANLGVLARSPEAFQYLVETLSAQFIRNLFQELCEGRVTRFRLDNMLGLNFLLENSLGGGGTETLRTDAQGKTFAQALLAQKVQVPKAVLETV